MIPKGVWDACNETEAKKVKKNAERSAHSQIIDFFLWKDFSEFRTILCFSTFSALFSTFAGCNALSNEFRKQVIVSKKKWFMWCLLECVFASIRFCHKMRNLLCYSLPFCCFFFANSIIAFTFLSRHWIVNTVDGTGDKIIYNTWQLGVCVAADRVDSLKMLLA